MSADVDDAYDILGVPRGASLEQVHKAWRRRQKAMGFQYRDKSLGVVEPGTFAFYPATTREAGKVESCWIPGEIQQNPPEFLRIVLRDQPASLPFTNSVGDAAGACPDHRCSTGLGLKEYKTEPLDVLAGDRLPCAENK